MKPRGRTVLLRCTAALLAFSYEAVSANLVFVAMDFVSPSQFDVATAEPAGAEHACGCSTSETRRAQCCCASDSAPAVCAKPLDHRDQDTPDDGHATFLSALRCAGQGPIDNGLTLKKLGPHVLPVLPGIAPVTDEGVSFVLSRPISTPAEPPDKVPI